MAAFVFVQKQKSLWALACQCRGLLDCAGALYVLYAMWMILPNQAGSLQGSCNVSCNFLAAKDLGIGSGWQQSKQNWTLPAVVGHWIRMECRDLCCAEDAPHQPFFAMPQKTLPIPVNFKMALRVHWILLGLCIKRTRAF